MAYLLRVCKKEEEVLAADALAGMNFFFKLEGDINNYKVVYDAKVSRKSLTKAFKEEKKDYQGASTRRISRKKHLQELVPDDYFEVDE